MGEKHCEAAKIFPVFQDKGIYRKYGQLYHKYDRIHYSAAYFYFEKLRDQGYQFDVLFARALLKLRRPQTFLLVQKGIDCALTVGFDPEVPANYIAQVGSFILDDRRLRFHGALAPDVSSIPAIEATLLEQPADLLEALVANACSVDELNAMRKNLLTVYNERFRRPFHPIKGWSA